MASLDLITWLTFYLAAFHHVTARSLSYTEREEDIYHPVSKLDIAVAGDVIEGVNWTQKGQQDLQAQLLKQRIYQPAKNVIFFIGDGMGVSTLTPARYLKAQRNGRQITDVSLSWENFDTTGIIKTYNVDQQTPDSAGTASSFMTGEKTRAGIISMNQDVPRGDCKMAAGNELKSFFHHSMDIGKWTGVVTTTRITHATPSTAYAHSADRDWESDADLLEVENGQLCRDIAWQLVHGAQNSEIRVILGGGRRNLMPNTTNDPEYPDLQGTRLDGLDLRQDWIDIHKNKHLAEDQYKYVENLTDFNAVDATVVQYLMGLFEPSHMRYDAFRDEDKWGEPSLSEMVAKSIDILQKGENGFFLFVEGGRIDHAHHDTNAYNALYDTLALEEAVQTAVNKTDEKDTLILLTADHSHTFSMGGYQRINNDILGIVYNINDEMVLAEDNKPYLTLSYANGPGFIAHRTVNLSIDNEQPRKDLTNVSTDGKLFLQDAGVPLSSETHGGEDVVVYARGPMSHLLTGIHEQNYIAHVIGYAGCFGPNKDMCINPATPPECSQPASGSGHVTGLTSVLLALSAIHALIG